MPDGEPLHRLTHGGGGTAAAFDPSGEILYTGSSGVPSLRLWHARTGRLLLADDRFLYPDAFATTACLVDEKRRDLVEVATAREYRAFTTNGSRGERHYWNPAIDPAGRLLVVGEEDGLGFWEPAGGTKLGKFLGLQGGARFFDGSGDLWTQGIGGVLRWPVRWGVDGAVHLGPPDRLATPHINNSDLGVSGSRDGRVVAVANHQGAVVLHVWPIPHDCTIPPAPSP